MPEPAAKNYNALTTTPVDATAPIPVVATRAAPSVQVMADANPAQASQDAQPVTQNAAAQEPPVPLARPPAAPTTKTHTRAPPAAPQDVLGSPYQELADEELHIISKC